MAEPGPRIERREKLDLDEGGSWVVTTASGTCYQLLLDGERKSVVRLAVDRGHSYPDGSHPMRRDGEVLPLLGLIDPPIEVGSRAYLVLGEVADFPGYVSTTRTTTPVVEIRRIG